MIKETVLSKQNNRGFRHSSQKGGSTTKLDPAKAATECVDTKETGEYGSRIYETTKFVLADASCGE